MADENKEGWGPPSQSRKWHYFISGRSLCGKFGWFDKDPLDTGNDNSPDNCAACKKKLAKLKK
jgi:hypothetical protein